MGYKIYKGEENKFYLGDTDKNESSDELILRCINTILVNKYNGYVFYAHNFGGYDGIFLLKALIKYNELNGPYYKLEDRIFRDNKLLRMSVKIKTKSGNIKISFVDSYALLQNSLDKLAKDFECDILKTYYPSRSADFVNESTLYYIGKTPDKHYYNNISDSEYNTIKKSNWDLKQETLNYLSNDLNSLMCVIDKFNKYIFHKYDLQIVECNSIARLSLNIFLKHYLGESKIPLITKKSIFDFIKESYFGGITEVYKPICENSYYYDVNSLYPYVGKNPMPGTECNYLEDLSKEQNLDDLFGFFYCRIKTNNNYLGLLPIHIDGNLILPNFMGFDSLNN